MSSTHYDVLEISRKATQEEIRAAYKLLVQRFHPDRNRGDSSAARLTQLINDAYKVLADPASRAAYDAELDRTRPSAELEDNAQSGRDHEPERQPHRTTKKARQAEAEPASRSDRLNQDRVWDGQPARHRRGHGSKSRRFKFRGLPILAIGLCAIAAGLLLHLGVSPDQMTSGFSMSARRSGADQAAATIRRSDAARQRPEANLDARAIAPAGPDHPPRLSKDDEVTIGMACRPLQGTGDSTGYQACIARQRALAIQTPDVADTAGSDGGPGLAASLACRLYQLNGDLTGHRECMRRESAQANGPTAPVEVSGAARHCVEVTTRDRTYMQCD